jgi:hypothetical protein
MKDNKEVYKLYRRMTRDYKKSVSAKATAGDKKAALDVLKLLNVDLTIEKLLGYEMSEDGRRIIKRVRTGKTLQEQQSKLALEAANSSIEAAEKLLESFANEIP